VELIGAEMVGVKRSGGVVGEEIGEGAGPDWAGRMASIVISR